MLIQSGLSSVINHAKPYQGQESARSRLNEASQLSAVKPQAKIRFEGYSEPSPHLGKATSSYMSNIDLNVLKVGIGQHIDFHV